MNALVWVVIIIVLAAIIWLVVRSRNRQLETRREEAAQLRDPAADHNMALREREASSSAAEAEARRKQAEADQRAAEAQQAQVQAERESARRDQAAAENEEKLRRADALDPDVKTDSEGYRIDDDGNRIENADEQHRSGLGTAAAAGAGAAAGGAAMAAHRDRDDDVRDDGTGAYGDDRGTVEEGARAGNWDEWDRGGDAGTEPGDRSGDAWGGRGEAADETRGTEVPPAAERGGDSQLESAGMGREGGTAAGSGTWDRGESGEPAGSGDLGASGVAPARDGETHEPVGQGHITNEIGNIRQEAPGHHHHEESGDAYGTGQETGGDAYGTGQGSGGTGGYAEGTDDAGLGREGEETHEHHSERVGNFRRETGEGDEATGTVDEREGDERSWRDRARDKADDLLGREDTDGDGRRG